MGKIVLVVVALGAFLTAGTRGLAKGDPDVDSLRAEGPRGLEAFLAEHGRELSKRGPASARLRTILDSLCEQYDCASSRLFWYTDLEAAKKEAARTGRPILSLHLLGKLSEELSCANSRFFRETLYSDLEIANHLRSHFVLHWRSLRPVPVVTIDFGDGRRAKRTVTGNSIHYVLDAEGRLIDALPGLYGPPVFLAKLKEAEGASQKSSVLSGAERSTFLRRYHASRLEAIAEAWAQDLERIGRKPSSRDFERLEAATDERAWSAVADLHRVETRAAFVATTLARSEYPTAQEAAPIARTKRVVESPVLRRLAGLGQAVALDTVRNEYLLHRQIHEWLIGTGDGLSLERFNEGVYAKLFLTPLDDPWMGLF